MSKFLGAMLFDLDGTLLDSAGGLCVIANKIREEHSMPHMDINELRSSALIGTEALVIKAMDVSDRVQIRELCRRYYEIYHSSISEQNLLFDGVKQLIATMDTMRIPWGIVTNKLRLFTEKIIESISEFNSMGCLVCKI